jgi:Ribbon-helix-helix domain
MANKKKKSMTPNRSGIPLTVYFTPEQATKLDRVSDERQVAKATLVRFAVERFLTDLRNGQLELPLGL